MTKPPLADSLATLQRELQAKSRRSLREAFEQELYPAVGVEYRGLFPAGNSEETLVEIPPSEFARVDPHPYLSLGAPYTDRSPFHLREAVLQRLQLAQNVLRAKSPGWSIQLFDAWRPLAVQGFMAEKAFEQLAAGRGQSLQELDAASTEALWNEVFTIWARPVADSALPPPHSTGAALDITLLDAEQCVVNMGSEIDAFGALSRPDYFVGATTAREREAHANRSLLCSVMSTAGFQRHPYEWWHFSYGDQLWALMCWLDEPAVQQRPLYGGLG